MKRKPGMKAGALALMLSLALLAACGSPAQTAENPSEQAAGQETEAAPDAGSAQETGTAQETNSDAEAADDGVLHIARQGLFSAGGTVTEPVEGEYNPALSWQDPTMAGNTAHVDHANVFYQIPVNDNGNPIVYLHGHGQSRMCWQTTPDGREGWSDLFLRKGHAAFLVDQPRRGEAGTTTEMTTGAQDMWEGTNLYKPSDQAMYTHFRIGLVAPDRYEGSQFPEGEETLNQFFRQMTPNTGTYDQQVCTQALGAVLKEVYEMTGNKSIFITHSQSAVTGWTVPKDYVSALVAIEPGAVPPTNSDMYRALVETKVPIVIYFGDYIDNGPENSLGTEIWSGVKERALAFAEQYNADGGECTVVSLPDEGITGNSHFLFQELNNAEIADHIEAWLLAHGLAG